MRKKRKTSAFNEYIETLTPAESAQLESFFRALKIKIGTNKKCRTELTQDFEKMFVYYYINGKKLSEAIEILSEENLGDFYSSTDNQTWFPLDNAAKIYPLIMNYNWMMIFRVSVYLKKEIVPCVLQMALDRTIKRFPYFATTVKKGFFFHYLDGCNFRFAAEEERTLPCSGINLSKQDSRSLRVIYYKNRISCEFFHLLTDGTGGMCFLKTLTAEYLKLTGEKIAYENDVLDINAPPEDAEAANDFPIADAPSKDKKKKNKSSDALQISGRRAFILPSRVLHFEFETDKLKNWAENEKATVTELLVTLLFFACRHTIRKKINVDSCIQIQVPVNMRNFYPSKTLRNFSMFCIIKIPYRNVMDFDSVLNEVKTQMKTGTSKSELDKSMAFANNAVKNCKYIPLFIKKYLVRWGYNIIGEKNTTTTLSNLGVASLPENMKNSVDKFDFVLGIPSRNKYNCSVVSYRDKTVLSLIKTIKNEEFELYLKELLESRGIYPKIYGSK